jgi:hypothetical protein
MIVIIGLAGLFASSAQSFALLRRSKEVTAVRQDLLSRLDGVRALSYAQLAKSDYVSTKLMPAGAAGDPTPFGMTNTGLKNFSETITVYGLGALVFSDDATRQATTPDWAGQYASQVSASAPAQPKTYRSGSVALGDWTLQVAGAMPYFQVTRTGFGTGATTTVVTPGDLTTDARVSQLLVDISYTWTDSNNVSRTQVAILIVPRNGSLQ